MRSVILPPIRLCLALALFGFSACAPASAQVSPIASVGGTALARGEYRSLALDEVEGVTLNEGRLRARGSRDTVELDLPPFVDTTQVVRHWALVTEAQTGGEKALTFTHDESLDDFTIRVPDSSGEIHYGAFAHRDRGDVLVLAWGRENRCYWGYVTIAVPAASPPWR